MKGTYGAVGFPHNAGYIILKRSAARVKLSSSASVDLRELKTDLSQKKFADTTTPQRVRVCGLKRKGCN
jgi:hypothetical protein